MNRILQEDIARFAADFSLWEYLRGRRIIITGATGLLGSCLVRCLLALNEQYSLALQVVSVVRSRTKAYRMFGEETAAHRVIVHDFASGEPFLPSEEADFLIHLAAPTASKDFIEHPAETLTTVVDSTKSVLEYARQHRLQSLVYVSTLEVYGTIDDDSRAIDEQMQGYLNPMDARSSYPMGKRVAECLCYAYFSEYETPVKTTRLAQTFGAGVHQTDGRVFAHFARSIINNEDIVLHTRGELCRSYCYTMDAVSGILYILLCGKDGEAYNIANERTYISIRAMAEEVLRAFCPTRKVVLNLQEGLGYSPTTKLRLDTTKIRSIGWQPRYELREMFSRLIESLREDGYGQDFQAHS